MLAMAAQRIIRSKQQHGSQRENVRDRALTSAELYYTG